jgi:DNA-binding XRE family transcriptional regulator
MGDDLERYITQRSERDPEFLASSEAGRVLVELVWARKAAKLTQKDVADALGVTKAYVAHIENGTRQPGYHFVFRYAAAVGLSIVVTPRKPATPDENNPR